jgi:hypothetical protein
MNDTFDPLNSNRFAQPLSAPETPRASALPPLDADPWVHWTYTSEEWLGFNQTDEEQRQSSWGSSVAAYGVAFFLILGFCAWFSFGRDWNEDVGVRLFFTIATPVAMVGGALLLTRQEANLGRLLARARQRGPREITIGPKGIREGRTFFPWRSGMSRLTHVRLDPGDPPVLLFRTTRPVNGTPIDYEIRVPVPATHVVAAQQLVERFTQLLESG